MKLNTRFQQACVAALLASAALCLCAAPAPARPAQKPNIIFVLIDDMGYGDLSCYGGVKDITPNIDSLAREGVRFSQFYVGAPICSPSRVAFTTGQRPARWRVTSFLSSRQDNDRRGMAQWLDPRAPSLARFLKNAGYATGHFGKWHMGGQRDVGEAPLITEYGFDESLTQFEGLGDRILPLLEAYDGAEPRKHALGSDNLGRGNIQYMERSKVTTAFVKRTIQFMRKAQSEGKPFYINLWPDDVHSPFFPPKHLRGDASKRELYLGVVRAMDQQFAPLFDYVRNTPSLRTNTVLIISSDNGPEPGAGSAGPFRGAKGTLFEGGIREPLIVWAPGLQRRGSAGALNSETVVCAVDLLPTVLQLAGVPLPAGTEFDGEDMSAAFLSKAKPKRSTPLFWSRPPDRRGNGERWPDLASRAGDWKLLTMRDGSNPQLFDLRRDPGETKNLAASRPDVVRKMIPPLQAWWKSLPAGTLPERARTPNSVQAQRFFTNPLAEGADPWMTRDGTNYILIQSEGNMGLSLYHSPRLTAPGRKHVIWSAPEIGPFSKEVWAPEIHNIDGRWIVYFAASDGANKNHKMWALESEGANPLGHYAIRGPIYTGDHPETGADNRWAIDGTILNHKGKRYFLWSGWEDVKDEQWLYIAEMKDPFTVGKRVRMCDNDDYLWERVNEKPEQRGLHEAPQPLVRDGRTFVIYSCSSSWQPTYKLGMLELKLNCDPLDPASWVKHPNPVFRDNQLTFGVGHNCFVQSPDGKEDWMVYHAKMDRADGWRRALFAQPFHWSASGLPQFGEPVAPGSFLPLPSGETLPESPAERSFSFHEQSDLSPFNYYGHHQFITVKDQRLHLGEPPSAPVNTYRCGEKVVINGGFWRNLTCSVRLNTHAGGRDAGILFRCTLPGIGYDAQNGYFAGIIASARKVVLGSMDGESWREIALADADVQPGRDHLLAVSATDTEIVVCVDSRELIRQRDTQHSGGSVGLRVVDTHAAFTDFTVTSAASR